MTEVTVASAPETVAPAAITVTEGITLELRASRAAPRSVRLKYDGKHMTCVLYRAGTPRRLSRTIAIAASEMRHCVLHAGRFPDLWVGSFMLDLTAREAEQIRATFAPVGLKVWEHQS